MSDIEFKNCGYEFKLESKGEDDAGVISGYAAVFGNIDRSGEVIVKGAFSGSLPDFRLSGFLAHEHQWKAELGTIEEAEEDETGLRIRARFYSTPDAQVVRQKLAEKIARGGRPGMSIGYRVLDDRREKGVRYLKAIDLVECSIVSVPANPTALVSAVKSLEISDEDRERAARARRLLINDRLARALAPGSNG